MWRIEFNIRANNILKFYLAIKNLFLFFFKFILFSHKEVRNFIFKISQSLTE